MNHPYYLPKWRNVLVILLICLPPVFCKTAMDKKAGVSDEDATIISALKRFNDKREDTASLPFLKTVAADPASKHRALANFMLGMIFLSERDTFRTANKYAEAALSACAENSRNQKRSFTLRPTIPYYQIMGPKERHIRFFRQHPSMLMAYATLLRNHAQLFATLDVRPLLYEVQCCFRDLNPVFYTTSPEFRVIADSTQVWLTEKTQDLPMQ